MSDPIVYRSTWPEVIAAYDAGMAQRKEWHARVEGFLAEHAGRRPAMSVTSFGTERIVGLSPGAADADDPPAGWRYDAERNLLVPDRRRKVGKAIAAALAALHRSPVPDLPGMPGSSLTGGRWLSPGMTLRDGTVYVRWSVEPDPPPSAAVWERCSLSAYYAATEREAAER